MKNLSESQVRISIGERSYKVVVGSGVIDRLGKIYQGESKTAVLISDRRLGDHRARVLKSLQSSGWKVNEILVDAGEQLKNFYTIYPLYGQLLDLGIDRSSTLFALGGGTIGDAAGFIASTFLRGIKWVGLPTTLLGQVDSGIGGKTGINHEKGKNLIGSFYQPALVVCETDFLKTLSKREIISGLGEVVKYGLTYDYKFFSYVRDHWTEAVALDLSVLAKLVKNSVSFKAKAVSKDEFDRKGAREVLNFGHTFGHALEKLTDYKGFQHGEAVLWGMRFAIALSRVKKKLSMKAWQEADDFLRQISLPPLPNFENSEVFKLMAKDKKAKDSKVRFVLLKKIGESVLNRNITEQDLETALEILKAEIKKR